MPYPTSIFDETSLASQNKDRSGTGCTIALGTAVGRKTWLTEEAGRGGRITWIRIYGGIWWKWGGADEAGEGR